MIHEPKPLSPKLIEEIGEQQLKIDAGLSVSCPHTFWKEVKNASFGDLILCATCCRYFAKVKHLPWVCMKDTRFPHTNHLPASDREEDRGWLVPVPVRVS